MKKQNLDGFANTSDLRIHHFATLMIMVFLSPNSLRLFFSETFDVIDVFARWIFQKPVVVDIGCIASRGLVNSLLQ